MYENRVGGQGCPAWVHLESEYDNDPDTGELLVKKRWCKKHQKEWCRYICKDHEEVLCPKCLVSHKICDFIPQGEQLTYEAKKRMRMLLTTIGLRHNLTNQTQRKLTGAIEGLDMYRDIQIDEINHSFNEIIKALNKRRDFLIKQVSDLTSKMKRQLEIDFAISTKKHEEELKVLTSVQNLSAFCQAVEKKEDKRFMVKWPKLCQLEREFDRIDKAWMTQRYYVYDSFRFPDD